MELDLVGYYLDGDTKNKIEETVNKFFAKANPSAILLFDKGGRVVFFRGEKLKEIEAEFLSSIMSALFFASEELTRLIEDKDTMKDIFYETKNRIFIVARLEMEFLIGVICKKDLSIGSVRLFFKNLVRDLNQLLQKVERIEKRINKISPKELEQKLTEILS